MYSKSNYLTEHLLLLSTVHVWGMAENKQAKKNKVCVHFTKHIPDRETDTHINICVR